MKNDLTMSYDEPAEERPQPRLWRRLLVSALYLSFFACLVSLSLTGAFFGGPTSVLSGWLMSIMENNHVVLLLAPLLSLLVCAVAIRLVAGETMTAPERYLDERQKMVRDQAHRSAYSILKPICFLVFLGFVVQRAFWPASSPPTTTTAFSATALRGNRLLQGGLMPYQFQLTPSMVNAIHAISLNQKGITHVWTSSSWLSVQYLPPPIYFVGQHLPPPTPWFNEPTGMALLYGVLLISLFLIITSLPMSVAVWRDRA
jgi:hypothetical protein